MVDFSSRETSDTLAADDDIVLEGCEGVHTYSIDLNESSSEQYVSIVAIDGDAKSISMECTSGTAVKSETATGWFYVYGIGLATQ